VNDILRCLEIFYVSVVLKILIFHNWSLARVGGPPMSGKNLEIGTVKYILFDGMVELWLKMMKNWVSDPKGAFKNCVWLFT